ncbi:protein GlmU [Desulfatitalea alkaliphila]|uniref:Protein GlmU n=1 Tax=Desulfatitalea alkaliphila TaxID=2929485 RepID=A0AA41UMD0_9BACT|nr:protein GlmU [Desulfatitalea alkaliphila]MCJ8502486.1 protein GlmU [Desulfatitalea alkaliphila]
MPDPGAVVIGDDVALDRISGDGVVLHPGSRISGARTFVTSGARIGSEGPATVENCYVGPGAALKGGYFADAVFLAKASCGLGAHVRQGTILEEQASVAHTVGLKQTILFPYVTLGSLINFCDCLMAGGTGRDNHSEVGSSYIHFNFTPNQDKATPSLIGDVPGGVMLNRSPVFLGGQGGLVGPCRLAYGTVTAAGIICRHDQLKENHLVLGGKSRSGSIPYVTGNFLGLKRILDNNFHYIGNLYALGQWYAHVRRLFVGNGLPAPLLEGLQETLQNGIDERIGQLGRLRDKLAGAAADGVAGRFADGWSELRERLIALQPFEGDGAVRDRFLEQVAHQISERGKDYLAVIGGLDRALADAGTQWLNGIVERVAETATLLTR